MFEAASLAATDLIDIGEDLQKGLRLVANHPSLKDKTPTWVYPIGSASRTRPSTRSQRSRREVAGFRFGNRGLEADSSSSS